MLFDPCESVWSSIFRRLGSEEDNPVAHPDPPPFGSSSSCCDSGEKKLCLYEAIHPVNGILEAPLDWLFPYLFSVKQVCSLGVVWRLFDFGLGGNIHGTVVTEWYAQ
jgi:hypothetical protein